MNENARKWVEALRSGKYEQAQEQLRRDDGFCCLGVACDLYAQETGEGEWTLGAFKLDGLYKTADLPIKVRDWLGLTSEGGTWGDADTNLSLIYLNDEGHPFAEIADTIESEPPGLFTERSNT